MKKICSICFTEKDISEFGKRRDRKCGIFPQCKSCDKERAIKNQRTKKGLIGRIYDNQKRRSKRRGHIPPSYTKEWLYDWLMSDPNFHRLFKNWKDSNYQTNLIPSVDRIDDNIGYTKSNIQVMTWVENYTKGMKDKLNRQSVM